MLELTDIPFGNRYIGFWEQQPVKSRKDVVNVVEEHLGIDNIGISVCTYKDGQPHLLFLPFDFDSSNLRKAWDDAKRLFNYCIRENISSYLSFSGRKGFHVFMVTIPKVYTRKQIKITQKQFKNKLALNTLDINIFGDRRRLMRIPGTYNINGNLCRVLAKHEGNLFNIDKVYEDVELPVEKHRHTNGESRFHDYPCVNKLIKDKEYWIKHHKNHKFEPAEAIRLTWVAIRLQELDIECIVKEAKSYNWDDWDEDKTRKKIEYLSDREWRPHSCESLKSLGYCIIKDCIYKKDISESLKEVGIK